MLLASDQVVSFVCKNTFTVGCRKSLREERNDIWRVKFHRTEEQSTISRRVALYKSRCSRRICIGTPISIEQIIRESRIFMFRLTFFVPANEGKYLE